MNLKKIEFSSIYKQYLQKYSTLKAHDRERLTNSLYIIFSLFTVSFFGFFAINPTLSTIFNVRRQYEDNKKVEQALVEKLGALDNLSREHQRIESTLPLINNAIPKSPSLPRLSLQIQSLVEEDHVIVQNVSYGGFDVYQRDIKGEEISSLDFRLSVQGKDSDVVQFLSDIINFERLVVLDSLGGEADGKGNLSLSLVGKIFFQRE